MKFFRCLYVFLNRSESELELIHYLSLLVDDGHRILQLDVVKQTRQEYVGHAD